MNWSIITIGHLSRNRFWKESESESYRDPLCTSTLIRTGESNIVVDPSLPPDQMADALFNTSGLKPDDIDLVYITHLHADHAVGRPLFHRASHAMAGADLLSLLASGDEAANRRAQGLTAVNGLLCPGIGIVSLPGHTTGLAGLVFEAAEGRILVTGDCVMTADFYRAQLPYYFGEDAAENVRSMKLAASLADVIIPGHGNYFMTAAYPAK